MADSTVFDLTAETALTAAHEFVAQDTSAATRAQAATFALMGGLEYTTAAPTSSGVTAVAGKLYGLDLSGLTTSNQSFTLPVAASINTGERVGFVVVTGDDDYFIEVITGAAGDLINGVDHSSDVFAKTQVRGDVYVFRCVDGATGDYVLEYKSITDKGFIEGAELVWTDNDTVQLQPGSAVVGGDVLTWTSNISSGNISTATAGRSVVGVWNWYLYDNAGTPAVEYVQDTPVWNDDRGYWGKAGPDYTRRWIGYHWVHEDPGDTTRKIANFMSSTRQEEGNIIEMIWGTPEWAATNQGGHFTVGDSGRILNGGTATSLTSVSCANCVAVPTTHAWAAAKINFTSDGDEGLLGLSSEDLDTYLAPGTANSASYAAYTVRAGAALASSAVFFGRVWLPLVEAQTFYYAIQQRTGSPTANIEVHGARFKR